MNHNSSLWKNRDFMILWSGQTISILGSQISQIVFPLLILYISKSPLQAGIGAALNTLPTLLFGLPAGVIVDRLDRKKLMIFCDIARALVMFSVPLAAYFNYLSVIHLYLAAFIEGTFSVFFTLAQIAAVSYIIPKNRIAEAVSQSEIGANTALFIGPSIGGFLYQSVGKAVPYLFDGISYLISVITLLFIRSDFQPQDKIAQKPFHLEILSGLVWLWNHHTLRLLALLTAGGALAGTAQNLLIILIAQKFGANAVVVGFIFSVASVGGIIGAIFARYYAGKLELIKTITWGRWLIAITYALLFFATTPSLLGIAVGLYYAVGPVYGTVLSSYRISLIPDAMQGRVTGVFRIIMYIGLTAGSMIAGFLSQTAGVNYTLYLMCVLLFTLAVIASIYFRKYPNSSRSNI